MGTLGMPTSKVTHRTVVPTNATFLVRSRLSGGEILALAVIIVACAAAVGYEFGVRRPALQEAAATKLAAQLAARPPVKAPAPLLAPQPEALRTKAAEEIVEFEVKDRATGPNEVSTDPRDDPFRTPGTIYRCRRYEGTVFWSNLHCSRHRGALIERIAKVPQDLPFDQQVKVARTEARKFESSLQAEQAELQRMNTCASLVGERAQILRREGDVTVLADVLAADRRRAKEIDASLQRLRCG